MSQSFALADSLNNHWHHYGPITWEKCLYICILVFSLCMKTVFIISISYFCLHIMSKTLLLGLDQLLCEPCPFNNLKCLKIDKEKNHTTILPTEVRDYFLESSPNVTFIMDMPQVFTCFHNLCVWHNIFPSSLVAIYVVEVTDVNDEPLISIFYLLAVLPLNRRFCLLDHWFLFVNAIWTLYVYWQFQVLLAFHDDDDHI